MKIAIIGAGFSGLGCAWHLMDEGCQVTLFDQKNVGAGASGIAAGLLHPLKAKKAKFHEFGLEGMRETGFLIQQVEQFTKSKVFEKTGIICCMESREKQQISKLFPQEDFTWLTEQEAIQNFQISHSGLFVKNAGILDSMAYLMGLFDLLKAKGLIFIQTKVEHIDELREYDCIIIAAGYWSVHIQGVDLSLQAIKGQLMMTDQLISPPRMHKIYALSKGSKGIIGATFERAFENEDPNRQAANVLLERCAAIGIERPRSFELKASLRAYSLNGYPIARKLKDNVFALTGLGSRGILLHALFARLLTKTITTSSIAL